MSSYLKSSVPQGTKSDGSKLYPCPLCHGRKKLEVDRDNRLWFCHKCGVGGKLGDHNQLVRAGIVPIEPEDHTRYYSPASPESPQWIYLRRFRGLSDKLIKELNPHVGPSLVRVYLPCYELGASAPCYFIGRAIFDGFERYQCPPLEYFAKRKSQCLWGLHRIRGSQSLTVVCEGIFDAVWEKNRVAILGKSISDQQVDILRRITTEEICVLLDGEAAAEGAQACKRIAKRWAGRVSLARLPLDLDPDGAGVERVQESLEKREVVG